jgi:hypothetical protein
MTVPLRQLLRLPEFPDDKTVHGAVYVNRRIAAVAVKPEILECALI